MKVTLNGEEFRFSFGYTDYAVVDKNVNRTDVITTIISGVTSYFSTDNRKMGDPLYIGELSQKINQINPTAPVTTNAICHPYILNKIGTTIGTTMAPMFAPELNIPAANALSFLGNHSATALIAAGKFPDSPIPNKERTPMNPSVDLTPACRIAAILQTIMIMV